MKRLAVNFLLFIFPVFANPLLTGVINEFQTDTLLGQKFEFHPINYGWEIPLLGALVYTPGCSAYVDTNISNPPYGYTVIDRSILNGTFHLNQQNGYIYIYKSDYFMDDISYADTFHSPILAPPPNTSASRFLFTLYYNYPTPAEDWYIDYTPTLGSENDDYPGCVISGYVYLNSIPIENARVTATVYDSIITQGPFCKCCTTFTNSNGFYSFDSLWPVRYWMTASFGNHPPIGELSPSLCALWEKHLNFYFVDIEEPGVETFNPSASLIIFPNPFRNHCVIKFQIPNPKSQTNPNGQNPNKSAIRNPKSEISLMVYDVAGRVVKSFNPESCILNHASGIIWDGCDFLGRRLPAGIYFVRLEAGDYKQIEKAVLLR
ncbi:MAG: hypothetical protein ABIL69_05945 [candidate division WOR-3 bacterium]